MKIYLHESFSKMDSYFSLKSSAADELTILTMSVYSYIFLPILWGNEIVMFRFFYATDELIEWICRKMSTPKCSERVERRLIADKPESDCRCLALGGQFSSVQFCTVQFSKVVSLTMHRLDIAAHFGLPL